MRNCFVWEDSTSCKKTGPIDSKLGMWKTSRRLEYFLSFPSFLFDRDKNHGFSLWTSHTTGRSLALAEAPPLHAHNGRAKESVSGIKEIVKYSAP